MISFLLFTWLSAQTVVPFSSTVPSIPPTGDPNPRNLECYDNPNCKAIINLHAYCYASNLRNVAAPLSNSSMVRGEFKINNHSISVMFPALYTYRVNASTICTPPASGTSGQISCAGGTSTPTISNYKIPSPNEFNTASAAAASDPTITANSPLRCSEPNCSCIYDIEPDLQLWQAATSGQGSTLKYYKRTGNIICSTPLSKQLATNTVQTSGSNVTVEQAIGQKFVIRVSGAKSALPPMPEMEYKDEKLVFKPGNSPVKVEAAFYQQANLLDVTGSRLPSATMPSIDHVTGSLTYNLETVNVSQESGSREIVINATFPGELNFCGGFYSPLMLFFDGKRPKFTGVSEFPLNEGIKYVNWPEANASGYWLVYDKKGKGEITKADQLFGSNESGKYTNGFEALKEYDSNKDALISKGDKQWKNLYLWNDKNGDGVSDKGEVFKLEDFGLESISLAYTSNQTIQIEDRAAFRERAHFTFVKGGKAAFGEVVDVWVTPHMLSKVPAVAVADSNK